MRRYEAIDTWEGNRPMRRFFTWNGANRWWQRHPLRVFIEIRQVKRFK